MSPPIVVTVPMRTVTGNPREHHMARHRRVSSERGKVGRLMPAKRPGPLLEVRLVRCAPRQLDPGDNLASSMKGVRDAVATWLRVDDASSLVRWTYEQEKAEAGSECVRIEVESMGGGMPTPDAARIATEAIRAALEDFRRDALGPIGGTIRTVRGQPTPNYRRGGK